MNAHVQTPLASRAHAYEADPFTPQEFDAVRAMLDAVAEAGTERVTLADMLEWVDDLNQRERAATIKATMVNGYVPSCRPRFLAVANKLVMFLEWCNEHREDVETLFRAKEYNKRRRT